MDDPFAEIKHDCEYSSSQEERLRHGRFCGESVADPEVPSSDNSTQIEGIPVDSTGIMMCSPPETPKSQSDEFLTPPEENLLMSSEEQTMNLAVRGAEDHHKKLKAKGDVSTDHVGTVDLGKNSNPRFSLEKSPTEKGKEVLRLSGESSSERQGITGVILGGAVAPACGARVDNVAGRSDDSAALGGNLGLLKQKFETASLQSRGVGGDIPVNKESAGKGFKENATKTVAPLKATGKDPEFGVHKEKEVRSNGEGGSSKKISQGRSNASKDVKGRRELPASIRGLMQNAAKRLLPDSAPSENQSFESLMDTLVTLSGEKNATSDPGNIDILETVERRGMIFPRPRWRQK
ncbi:uncharacterized protein LOC122665383 [Telopea speciosissima]|uniref:uncharacterized protein LOC122665383 n=1 Tax=Telopea speciosissima TaxID=54955 RepID=UPI001CC373FC|nr:uncharacterized protein LOC122665383 [Telopea speciosissima]